MRILFAILALLLLFVVGCRPSAKTEESPEEYFAKRESEWKPPKERSDVPVTAAQLAECSQRMNVRFSTNTVALGFKKETGGMDDAIFLKVRMPVAEVEEFIAASPLANQQFGGLATLPGANTMPWWWNFTRKGKIRYAQTRLPKGEALHILIDAESDFSAIVYLVWHQT
ncbi:MAG TPA: hypothetical protein PKA41_01545 [Verrucomicrobiota bacterium]|nr:hypothetical protein [Verrucomicrobiota bacterium]